MQPSLLDLPLTFDGESFDPSLDQERLAGQFTKVKALMLDGHWRTLSEIQALVGGSEAGISARLRDLRKPRFGAYRVERRRRYSTKGIWEYQVTL